MTAFNWPALLAAGLHGLALKPDEFWALTPAELAMMLNDASVAAPLSRSRFDELAQLYPDQSSEE